MSQQSYKLVNSWILDGSSDTRVCNNPKQFHLERIATKKDVIMVGKTTHQIETLGTVEIIAKSSRGLISIKLLNVALITEFFTNLICLDRFEQKSVFHHSENSRLQQKGETFCYVNRMSSYKMIEYNPPEKSEAIEPLGAFASSSDPLPILQTTGAEWHAMLGHSGSETLHHLEKSAENIRVISSEWTSATNECDVCSFIKAYNLISKRPGHEKSCDRPFEKTDFDFILQHEGYNGDNWVSHFTCFHTKIEFVYTHLRKNDNLNYTSEWCGLSLGLATKTQPANGVGWVEFFFGLPIILVIKNRKKCDFLNALKIDFKTFYFWSKFWSKISSIFQTKIAEKIENIYYI